jgi:hypothetical protein
MYWILFCQTMHRSLAHVKSMRCAMHARTWSSRMMPSSARLFYSYRNSSGTQRYGLTCSYTRLLLSRDRILWDLSYPQIRSIAVCTSSECRIPSNHDNVFMACKQLMRLEPALVKNESTQLWEFKLEEIPIACVAQEKSDDY